MKFSILNLIKIKLVTTAFVLKYLTYQEDSIDIKTYALEASNKDSPFYQSFQKYSVEISNYLYLNKTTEIENKVNEKIKIKCIPILSKVQEDNFLEIIILYFQWLEKKAIKRKSFLEDFEQIASLRNLYNLLIDSHYFFFKSLLYQSCYVQDELMKELEDYGTENQKTIRDLFVFNYKYLSDLERLKNELFEPFNNFKKEQSNISSENNGTINTNKKDTELEIEFEKKSSVLSLERNKIARENKKEIFNNQSANGQLIFQLDSSAKQVEFGNISSKIQRENLAGKQGLKFFHNEGLVRR